MSFPIARDKDDAQVPLKPLPLTPYRDRMFPLSVDSAGYTGNRVSCILHHENNAN